MAVGVVTLEGNTVDGGKEESSLVVGTNSMLFAKLEPFFFFFSRLCFFSGVFELCTLSFFTDVDWASDERELDFIFLLLIIGGSLSTSSGGLDGSFVPVER